MNSRCVLYKSATEEVSVWGWPLQTAGLLTTGFSSRSFSILSGRVTEVNQKNMYFLIYAQMQNIIAICDSLTSRENLSLLNSMATFFLGFLTFRLLFLVFRSGPTERLDFQLERRTLHGYTRNGALLSFN